MASEDISTDFEAKLEESSGLTICGIKFASADDLTTSEKEAAKRTEPYTVSKHITDIAELVDIPKLKKGVWSSWIKAIRAVLRITSSSAAFIDISSNNESHSTTMTVWRLWWIKTLKSSDSGVAIHDGATPREILTAIITVHVNKSIVHSVNAARAFWGYSPGRVSLHTFMTEFEKRLNNLRPYVDL